MAHYSTTEFRNESLLEPEMVALAARLGGIERNQAPPFTLALPAVLAELAVATNSSRPPSEAKPRRGASQQPDPPPG